MIGLDFRDTISICLRDKTDDRINLALPFRAPSVPHHADIHEKTRARFCRPGARYRPHDLTANCSPRVWPPAASPHPRSATGGLYVCRGCELSPYKQFSVSAQTNSGCHRNAIRGISQSESDLDSTEKLHKVFTTTVSSWLMYPYPCPLSETEYARGFRRVPMWCRPMPTRSVCGRRLPGRCGGDTPAEAGRVDGSVPCRPNSQL